MTCCPICGAKLENPGRFCGFCGASLPAPQEVPSPVSEAPVSDFPVSEAPASDFSVPESPVSEPPVSEPPVSEPLTSDTGTQPQTVKKKKNGLLLAIIPLVLILVGIAAYFAISYFSKSGTYNKALTLMEEGSYDEALDCFVELEDFKDSEAMADQLKTMEWDYTTAMHLLKCGSVDKALELFKSLGSYKDSQEQAEKLGDLEALYQKAQALWDEGSEDEALAMFQSLGDYKDSADKVEQLEALEQTYRTATNYMTNGAYDNAVALFEELDGYKDSEELLQTCIFEMAMDDLESGYAEAAFANEDSFTEEQKQELYNTYNALYADPTLLEAMESALTARLAVVQTQDYKTTDAILAEVNILQPYTSMLFRDAQLKELFFSYMDVLNDQLSTLDSEGELDPSRNLEWEQTLADRYSLFDDLYAQYHFLGNNQDLYENYIGYGEYYTANFAISNALEYDCQSVDDSSFSFYNSTDYDYDFITYIECYKNDELVYTSEEVIVHVGKGETVLLQYPDAPANIDCDSIFPIANHTNVTLDGRLLKVPQ